MQHDNGNADSGELQRLLRESDCQLRSRYGVLSEQALLERVYGEINQASRSMVGEMFIDSKRPDGGVTVTLKRGFDARRVDILADALCWALAAVQGYWGEVFVVGPDGELLTDREGNWNEDAIEQLCGDATVH